MQKIKQLVLLTLATLLLAACVVDGPGSNDGLPDGSEAILVLKSDDGELTLASLQVNENVYTNVTLKLLHNNTWTLKSIGPLRPLLAGELAQAVLTRAGDAPVVNMDWRPVDAMITIRRIHIDGKVYGSVPLELIGNTWNWGEDWQPDDLADVPKLLALSMADFKVDPLMFATDAHTTVLQSGPDGGKQSVPMKLDNKQYTFCMDAQDQGADSIRLLDASGKAVVSLKAGEPCFDILLAAGSYTMEHRYGGSGASRTLFIRPEATPEAVPTAAPTAAKALAIPRQFAASTTVSKSILSASDPAFPEYWALALTDGSGILSHNGLSDEQSVVKQCSGVIDAAAKTGGYQRPGGGEVMRILDSHNFFQVNFDGITRTIGLPLSCRAGNSIYFTSEWTGLYILPKSVQTRGYVTLGGFIGNFQTEGDANSFRLYSSADRGYAIRALAESYLDFTQGIVAEQVNVDLTYDSSLVAVPRSVVLPSTHLNIPATLPPTVQGTLAMSRTHNPPIKTPPATFKPFLRYFPSGLPRAQIDGNGMATLQQGEIAFFAGNKCDGAVLIGKGPSLPLLSWDSNWGLPAALGTSIQLGPQTHATFTNEDFEKSIAYRSDCILGVGSPSYYSVELTTSTRITVQTNGCEQCNLAGLDLSNEPKLLQGVNLKRADLTNAILSNSDLTGADLRFATLQGATLVNTNLEAANLCQAALNAPSSSGSSAATLTGAHLKNANLSGTNLDGADFTNASFFSSSKGACQSACAPGDNVRPTCASAYQASINNTHFNNAYMANVDMSAVTASGARFSNAMLFGARFVNAKLSSGASTGTAANFAYAFLQGADFSNATLTGVNFSSAYIEADSGNDCTQIKLRNELTGFANYQSPTKPGSDSCEAKGSPKTDVQIPSCISVIYPLSNASGSNAIGRPVTNSTNICPDGNQYPNGCTEAAWLAPGTALINSQQTNRSCQAKPRLCDPFAGENTCWNVLN